MKVSGRRAIIVPPADAFGEEGNPQLGLPAGTDMVIVVDLLGVYGQATG
jgi:FKBP-type peptidyl-prolyl cis-trans isomerase